MSNLARIENSPDKAFCEMIAKVVEMLFDSLDTYGKKATSNLTDAWILVLHGRGIRFDELMPAAYEFLQRKDFPKPGEVCDWIEGRRENLETKALLRDAEVLSVEERERRAADFERRHNLVGASREEIQAVAIAAMISGSVKAIEGRRTVTLSRDFVMPTEDEAAAKDAKLAAMKARLGS